MRGVGSARADRQDHVAPLLQNCRPTPARQVLVEAPLRRPGRSGAAPPDHRVMVPQEGGPPPTGGFSGNVARGRWPAASRDGEAKRRAPRSGRRPSSPTRSRGAGPATCPAGNCSTSPWHARWRTVPRVVLLMEPFACPGITRADLQFPPSLPVRRASGDSPPARRSPTTSPRRSCWPTAGVLRRGTPGADRPARAAARRTRQPPAPELLRRAAGSRERFLPRWPCFSRTADAGGAAGGVRLAVRASRTCSPTRSRSCWKRAESGPALAPATADPQPAPLVARPDHTGPGLLAILGAAARRLPRPRSTVG